MMAKVYAASICTFSALGSEDGGGFCRVEEKKTNFAFRYDLSHGSQCVRVYTCEPAFWMLDGPLVDKACTLQERDLSSRILHFSRDELLWEWKMMRVSAIL